MAEAVSNLGSRVRVDRLDRLEFRVVAIPVGVEADAPAAGPRHADPVVGQGSGREVRQDDHVVARSALEPAVIGEDALLLVQVVDDDVRSAQAATHVDDVPAEADEVAVELQQARVPVPKAPVDPFLVA